jgi:hypothetical protein
MMRETEAAVEEIHKALIKIGKPRGRQPKFLQAHYDSNGRASTATILAQRAGYKSYRGVNLQYGVLAEKLAKEIGYRGQSLAMVCDWAERDTITNAHYVLIMRPNFAEALKSAGWVTG